MQRVVCLAMALGTAMLWALSSAHAQQSRPAGQWLEWVRDEAKRERATIQADPAMAAIFRGAAASNDPYFDPVKKTSRHAGISADATDIAAYETFMAGEGKGLVQQVVGGQRPDSPYLPVAQAHVIWQADKVINPKRQKKQPLTPGEQACLDAYNALISNGRNKLAQAYRQAPLSREDLADIRAYALYADIRCTGAKVLPFQLNVMAKPVLLPGDAAPDFCLPKALPIIESPDFKAPPTFDLLRPLTWTVVEPLLLAIEGYEVGPDDKVVASKRNLELPAGAREQDYIRLSSFRGRKPVLLIIGDATDTYTCHGIISSKLEDVYRAFRDRIEIMWVNDTVHDSRMPFFDYFAASPSAVRGVALHAIDLQSRAATARSYYMTYPYTSIPCVLDRMTQTTRNAFADMGGEAEFWLIDVNGTVAYRTKGPNECSGWEYSKLHTTHIIRTDCLVRAMVAMLGNDGKYVPASPTKCDHAKITDAAMASLPKPPPGTLWIAGEIAAVGASANSITIERDAVTPEEYPALRWWPSAPKANAGDVAGALRAMEQWKAPDAPRSMQFTATPKTYMSLNGNTCEVRDLRVGDRAGVQISPAETQTPLTLRAFRLPLARSASGQATEH